MNVQEVRARKIHDSRGAWTIEVIVNGVRASAPSGKSTGTYETLEYHESLEWNISELNNLKVPFSINNFSDLKKVELLIRKKYQFKNATEFGANALFALESALLKALAKSQKKELWQVINPRAKQFPVPLGNAIGGGLHSAGFKHHPAFQEFLLIPKGANAEFNYRILRFVYRELETRIHAKSINDEGAWQTGLTEEEILTVLSTFSELISIGLDVAASSFFKETQYVYHAKQRTRAEQITYINRLIEQFPIEYLEDPLHEEDFSGFAQISKKAYISGDDLTVTHLDRLKTAVLHKSVSAMIVKPNQNGSLLEVADIVAFCKQHNIKTAFSHRSGETMDSALADYAFAFQTDYIKCGIATPWREAKLKRLVEIEKSFNNI